MNKKLFCQSCGYPMEAGSEKCGTNSDGTRSDTYCSMCYKDGKFLSPPEVDTAEKFQKYCMNEMKKDGMNGIMAWLLTRGIPKLKRWRK